MGAGGAYPVKGGRVLGRELQLADDHLVRRDAAPPHVPEDVDEIGVVQPLDGRADEGAVDVGVGGRPGFLEGHARSVRGQRQVGESSQLWHAGLGELPCPSGLLCRPASGDRKGRTPERQRALLSLQKESTCALLRGSIPAGLGPQPSPENLGEEVDRGPTR